MRVAAAIAMSLILLVGTHFYCVFADSVRREPVRYEPKMDDGIWRIEISRTFDCVPDPESLLLRLHGEILFRSEERLLKSEKVVIEGPAEIEQGDNEIYVEANVAAIDDFEFSADETPQALRLVVHRGDVLIADQTYWLKSGATSIRDSLRFSAPVIETPVDANTSTSHGP